MVVAKTKYQLKHRLTGSIILIAVAVLGIPWLLSEPKNQSGVGDTEPSINQDIFTFQVLKPQPVPDPSQSSQQVAVIEEGLVKQADVLSTPVSAPVQPPETLEVLVGWFVRVGTFSQQQNIVSVLGILKKQGLEAHQTVVALADGKSATRIWLGPYAESGLAREVGKRLEALTGEKGFVINQQ